MDTDGGLDNDRAKTLIERIASGNEPALAEFYRIFEERVYAFALRRLSDAHLAAEVLNEVMFEVWRNAAKFESRSKVSSWVLGIARHKIMDHYRKIYRRENREQELDANVPDGGSVDLEGLILNQQISDFLQQCLKKLGDIHKEIIHLAFFEGLSYKEISEIVECPEGTVKTRMYHAKEALKPCLKNKLEQGSQGGD